MHLTKIKERKRIYIELLRDRQTDRKTETENLQ